MGLCPTSFQLLSSYLHQLYLVCWHLTQLFIWQTNYLSWYTPVPDPAVCRIKTAIHGSIPCSCSHLHLSTSAWSWYMSTIPLGTVLQIPSLSPSLCAIVVILRLSGRASLKGHAWGLLEWCGAPIQPVHSNTLAQQEMEKKDACSGRVPAWSLDMPEAHIQAQMLGNCWVHQHGHYIGQRLLLHFTATLLKKARHWQLLHASEICASKHGIPYCLPTNKTKSLH